MVCFSAIAKVAMMAALSGQQMAELQVCRSVDWLGTSGVV
jgi:hypothetical protein